jgi:hypothetical protein
MLGATLYTRKRRSRMGARAKAWCILIHAEAAVSPSHRTGARAKSWCPLMHVEAALFITLNLSVQSGNPTRRRRPLLASRASPRRTTPSPPTTSTMRAGPEAIRQGFHGWSALDGLCMPRQSPRVEPPLMI